MAYLGETPALTDNTFVLLRDLVHERTGIMFENSKRDLMADKLAPLVADRGFDSFLDYYYLLKYDEGSAAEWRRVQSALAVNETYFWREFDQIRAAADVLVPHWQRQRPGRPVRIWHAACATGEEPYTMAIALMEAGRLLYGPIDIIATDFNAEALERARRGVYRENSFRAIPPEIRRRYFVQENEAAYRLVDPVRAEVHFEYLNLADDSQVRRMPSFDLIFCRNTFIYFSTDAIRRVSDAFHASLNPDGYLFLGATESLLRVTPRFELVEVAGAFGYRPVGVGSPAIGARGTHAETK